MQLTRRKFLGAAGSGLAVGTLGSLTSSAVAKGKGGGHVVVIGGGFGGATAAKYLRMWGEDRVKVTLIEPNENFVSCPISNLVIGGVKKIDYITSSYEGLTRNHGVERIKAMVKTIDAAAKTLTLSDGTIVSWDKLVVSPGIDFMYDDLGHLGSTDMRSKIMHAWKAGPQTVTLASQLADMADGGVFALAIPRTPYRCPPGPYERACQVANYLKKNKPKSRLIVLDANEKIASKGKLFKEAWDKLYAGIIDYRPNHTLVDIDKAGKELQFEINDPVSADVINVIPAMRAGQIAVDSGLANANGRWCHVNFLNFESTALKHVHVLGDSIQTAPGMPKSGHMANQQAKVAAAAIISELSGKEINQTPVLTNTCYSFVSAEEVVHVASVHQYSHDKNTFLKVKGAGGLSAARNQLESVTAIAWAKNIWSDMLA